MVCAELARTMLPSRIRAELVDNMKYLLYSSLRDYKDAIIHKLKVAARMMMLKLSNCWIFNLTLSF